MHMQAVVEEADYSGPSTWNDLSWSSTTMRRERPVHGVKNIT